MLIYKLRQSIAIRDVDKVQSAIDAACQVLASAASQIGTHISKPRVNSPNEQFFRFVGLLDGFVMVQHPPKLMAEK